MNGESPSGPFEIRDCSVVSRATGIRAQSLREFRTGLMQAPLQCIFHHFWGRYLRPQFDEREFSNDFAGWARHALHEKALAEQLSAVNPVDFKQLDDLREQLLEIIDERLDAADIVPWARADQQFQFIRSEIIVFDTEHRLEHPRDLPAALEALTPSGVYYHFIDARRRTMFGRDDFSVWLDTCGPEYAPVVAAIHRVDPFFFSLTELQKQIAGVVRAALETVTHD